MGGSSFANMRNIQGAPSRIDASPYKAKSAQGDYRAQEATIAQGVEQYGVNRASGESSEGITPPKGRFVDIFI